MTVFGLSLIFVFLILAALYESWLLLLSVLFSAPVGAFGASLALAARHLENNVYVQIGLIMLIGLAARNAILIIEFVKREYERGRRWSRRHWRRPGTLASYFDDLLYFCAGWRAAVV